MNDNFEILARLRAHDAGAFKAICLEYTEKMELFAFVLLNDPIAADELVAELLERMWKENKFAGLEPPLHAFLFREVEQACMEIIKNNKNTVRIQP
jgi:DNA-directed RNA polymerase specialized sigma24 family protein